MIHFSKYFQVFLATFCAITRSKEEALLHELRHYIFNFIIKLTEFDS